jgi:predicted nucleic acid-binding protein
MIYCDSSFLVALYLRTDHFSVVAREIADSFYQGVPYPWLAELELTTSLYRVLGAKRITRHAFRLLFSAINDARAQGFLTPCALDQANLFRKALELSRRHTARHQCRTLDILHVAAALELEAQSLASFDFRQRKLAVSAGLNVLPEKLPDS